MAKLKYTILEIPVQEILFDDTFNCRGYFGLESVESLAKSIQAIGLQFPVLVQPFHGQFKYRLLAGHRRFKAVKNFLNWKTIPAIVRDDLTEYQARILNLTENLQRRDLNLLQEAKALQGLYPGGIGCEGGTSIRQVAKEIQKPSRWVCIRLRLLAMPEEIQKYAAAGWLSAVNLEAIWELPEEERVAAAERIVTSKRTYGKTSYLKHGVNRSFVNRRSKNQICEMIANLYNHHIEGLHTRLLAWAAGYISDEEIKQDIDDHIAQNELTPRPPDQYLVPRISKSRGRPHKEKPVKPKTAKRKSAKRKKQKRKAPKRTTAEEKPQPKFVKCKVLHRSMKPKTSKRKHATAKR